MNKELHRVVVIENNEMGIKTYNYDLVKTLSEKYTTTVLTEITGVFEKGAAHGQVEFVNVGKSVLNPVAAVQYIYRLYKALKKAKPDVCLTFTIRPNIYGNIVTRILGIPTITSITGIGPLFESKSLSYRIARWLYKRVLKKTHRVVFPNQDDLNLFVENKFITPAQAQIVAGSGINIDHFAPMTPKTDNNGKFVFLYIGRLLRDKGVIEFVEAAAQLKKVYPEASCQIIGPVWDSNKKSLALSQADVDGWVSQGWISYLGTQNDVRPFIAAADCIVMPSYREGMNNVLLEAASMEKPLITTNVTGCKEIVDDGVNGLLCRVKDSADLAEKMLRMAKFTPGEREQMGKKGREKMKQEFDKRIVVGAYITEIEKVMQA